MACIASNLSAVVLHSKHMTMTISQDVEIIVKYLNDTLY